MFCLERNSGGFYVRKSMGQILIKKLIVVRFVVTTELMQIQVWWDATSFQLANSYQLFRAACFLCMQGQLSEDRGRKLFLNVSSHLSVNLESYYRVIRRRECQISPYVHFLSCTCEIQVTLAPTVCLSVNVLTMKKEFNQSQVVAEGSEYGSNKQQCFSKYYSVNLCHVRYLQVINNVSSKAEAQLELGEQCGHPRKGWKNEYFKWKMIGFLC